VSVVVDRTGPKKPRAPVLAVLAESKKSRARLIVNAKILPRLHDALTDLGCFIPIICTPEEMLDDDPKENEW
jgi:hypothetical protein